MDDSTRVASYLAQNIAKLRYKKKLSQQQLAAVADIPRSTLTNIESGSGNPSLTNLVKVSEALGVGVEELLSRPRAECSLISAGQIPIQKRNQVQIYKLLPDKIKGLEIDRIEFEPSAIMGGHPHLAGTKEYMTVIKGEVIVHVAGEHYAVKKGDVFAFPGNQAHSYQNPKKVISIVLSIVIPVPVCT